MSGAVTIGVEQEFFLVDPDSVDLRSHRGEIDVAVLREALGARYAQEFLACIVETRTPIAHGVPQALDFVRSDRRDVLQAVQQLGLLPYPAGTHPRGQWRQQQQSQADRYSGLATEMGLSVRSSIYCGLHVHIGVADEEDRIPVVRALLPYLPFMLALSASSPFWQGDPSGYCSFRSRIQGVLPRSGIPPDFASWAEYSDYIRLLAASQVADASTKVWWDIRPSGKFPTVEIRIADAMPSVDEQASLIALMVCATIHLQRNRALMPSMDRMAPQQIEVNRWLAQRDGTNAQMLDKQFVCKPFIELLSELLERLAPIAGELGCLPELLGCMQIARSGSSASRQVSLYEKSKASGMTHEQALGEVQRTILQEAWMLEEVC